MAGGRSEERLSSTPAGGGRHVTPEWVLHSNFGCCIGTIQKSAPYKISGALERRGVPIRELFENKRAGRGKNRNQPRVYSLSDRLHADGGHGEPRWCRSRGRRRRAGSHR